MDSTLEVYHQRIAQIQEVSDVIAVANMQLNKVLSRLGWSRSHLMKKNDELEVCPLDKTHRIRKNKLEEHTRTCSLRQLNINSIKSSDVPYPPFYDLDSSVVPTYVSNDQYEKMGVGLDTNTKGDMLTDPSKHLDYDAMLLETDEGINKYVPCSPLDELRFIYSWHKIPQNYVLLDVTPIPKSDLQTWLTKNLSECRFTGDPSDGMANSLLCWLTQLPTPSQICSRVQDVLKGQSRMFVLKLWKFIAAKCLCLKQDIPEHTRNEFEFYTSVSMSSQHAEETMCTDGDTDFTRTPLPAEWMMYNLSAKEKLGLYDEVCKTARTLKQPTWTITDLQNETVQQENVISEFDGQQGTKSRLEVMAELRDFKRRRQSYRTKNKGQQKLSGYDVLRETYEQQMLFLKLSQECGTQEESKDNIESIQVDGGIVDRTVCEKMVRVSHEGDKEKYMQNRRSRSHERSRRRRRRRSRSTEGRRSGSRDRDDCDQSDNREMKSIRRHRGRRDRRRSRTRSKERRSRYGRDERSRDRSRTRSKERRSGYGRDERSRDRSRTKSKERRSGYSRDERSRDRSRTRSKERRSGYGRDERSRDSCRDRLGDGIISQDKVRDCNIGEKEISNKTYYMDTDEKTEATQEGKTHQSSET